ncbi:Soluble aldose sugar dehydrogenase YliI precursor [Enhygromyxa salina]|uniref:Soluble aldose sugar dehydrogenase YliI n=1 Tax=Enhygromyxa salina TaxID=215803 RepID=A0A2S9YHY3_9BACT|nr:PQQ-dependent sugar dehydrogenase [Enhygromyxa salina]PRQ04718.1 Soluble aldose sugar dehydrogenase YliI precursor [Enhygromyxa salina]
MDRALAVRLFALASLVCAACSPAGAVDDGGGDDETGETGGETTDESLPALGPRPSTRSCVLEGTAADALPRLIAEPLDRGPSFDEAAQLLAAPGSGMWVVEARGRVWSVAPDESLEPSLVVDLSARVDCCDSRGLLAVALAPGPDPGELFVHYHDAAWPERTIVARMSYDAEAGTADPQTEQTVLTVVHEGTAASGGGLVFDAGGMLLVGVGDDATEAPQLHADSPARDPLDLRGSVLRLDVSEPGPGYAIPADNPFATDPDARPELLAIGFHDPRACATDPEGARSWCVDLGAGLREELDLLLSGADYGWPVVEGRRCTQGPCDMAPFAAPEADYGLQEPDAAGDHCGIVGPLGYRGAALPEELAGAQLFADRCSGRVWGVAPELGFEVVAAASEGVAALGPDAAGEPWFVDGEGRLARLVLAPDGLPGTLPSALSQLECFDELEALDPGPDLIPFTVASALWSDGLHKLRHMVVPPGERVLVQDDGRWTFPEGSLLIKTFILEAVTGDADSRRPIETRFMVRRNGVWEFHSYRWNEEGSDAELLVGGAQAQLSVEDQAGVHEFEWGFPDRVGCRICHGFGGGRPLGPTTAQLNRPVIYREADDTHTQLDQLAAFAAIDLLEFEGGATPALETLPALADPRDDALPLDDRARAYLDSNCAPCHQPSWMVPDLRASISLADTGVCEPLAFASLWVDGDIRVVPGEPEQSNLWLRMATRGMGQMPPLGTAVVDPLAIELIGAWIEELDCP